MSGEHSRRTPRKANSTLLWEALRAPSAELPETEGVPKPSESAQRRSPFDDRCVARTKNGHRCRCRSRVGSDYCTFHDPSVSADERRAKARKAATTRRSRPTLPKGYPRRLSNPEAARMALERLYVEARAGQVTPEQAEALLHIINRLIDWPAHRSGGADATTKRRGDDRGERDSVPGSAIPCGPGQVNIIVHPPAATSEQTAYRQYDPLPAGRFGGRN